MKRELNICIVSREYPPETLWGGIGTFTYNLAHGLNSIGHNVDIVAFTPGQESHSDDEGISVYRISSPRLPLDKRTLWEYCVIALFPFAFFYSLKIKKKIEELDATRHYDVIDFPEHIGEGFFTVRANKYPSFVRLYTPLSLIGKLGLHRVSNVLDYYLLGLIEKSSIKRATVVNSPSNNLAQFVKKEFRVERNIELIYNPIDTDRFSPKPTAEESTDEILKVLFVARLLDRKGAHILARAVPKVVEKVKNVKFIIIGNDDRGVEGFKSMKEFMLHVFKENDVMEFVEFIDWVPYDKLEEVYRGADISILPALYDNSPYTCLEAMSCGVPVIATTAGGMPEYVDDGKNGIIIAPNDVDALAEALKELLSDAKKRRDYGIKAREKAVREFKREVVAKKITRLYLEAIESFKGR